MAAATRTRTLALTRLTAPDFSPPVDIEALARASGLHPELVRRFVRLGLLEPAPGGGSEPRFRAEDAARLAQAVRLRRDLALGYAGAVLASELLARIDDLEERLSRYEPRIDRPEVTAWIRTG